MTQENVICANNNKHCEKSHFTNLTFRMLCNIHFQKYDRYKILTTIISLIISLPRAITSNGIILTF